MNDSPTLRNPQERINELMRVNREKIRENRRLRNWLGAAAFVMLYAALWMWGS